MFEIKRVESKKDWSDFIELPWKIYANDPHWVPPLRVAVRDTLDVNKNPFFKHAYLQVFNAYRGGEIVGRIAGVIDENHNKKTGEKILFFGFFEAINDSNLTDLLFREVIKWGNEWGMDTLRGPMNPSSNHEMGLLVDGFNDSPYVMTTYNPPYYLELFEKWGLKKSKDLFAYSLQRRDAKFSSRLLGHAERMKQRGKVTFRSVNMKKFDEEVDQMLEVYNDAWEDNWGFVPMNQEEFRHMAKDMKMILDPGLILIAEVAGKMVGFSVALPDVNLALKQIPDGKLLPSGLLKLLWNVKGPGRKKVVRRCRVMVLGIRKRYQALGVGPLLYTEYLNRAKQLDYDGGEASWILEDNIKMTKAIEEMRFQKTKTYRIFDRPLGDRSLGVQSSPH